MAFMNWLLPLETLPGWPEAPEVSLSHMLMLMYVGPLAVGVIVALIAFTPALGRRFRGELAADTPHAAEHPALEAGTRPGQAELDPPDRHSEKGPDA